MAVKIYYQEDCNMALLEGKTIAIIGYGSQGLSLIHIQMCIRDRERENAMQGAKAEIAGLAMEAAKKLLLDGSSENGNRMLYDEFLAKAGDAHDTDLH